MTECARVIAAFDAYNAPNDRTDADSDAMAARMEADLVAEYERPVTSLASAAQRLELIVKAEGDDLDAEVTAALMNVHDFMRSMVV